MPGLAECSPKSSVSAETDNLSASLGSQFSCAIRTAIIYYDDIDTRRMSLGMRLITSAIVPSSLKAGMVTTNKIVFSYSSFISPKQRAISFIRYPPLADKSLGNIIPKIPQPATNI